MGAFNSACGRDLAFFRGVAREVAQVAGTNAVRFYCLDLAENRDPLYQEATTTEMWLGPYTLNMTLEYTETEGMEQVADESGVETESDGTAEVAVTEWSENVRGVENPGPSAPKEGDVIGFFEPVEWFDVIKVAADGYIGTGNQHTAWKITLKARSSFTPNRRLP